MEGPPVRSGPLHVNPGGHVQVPVFENDSAESFFVRHLGVGG